MRILHSMIHLIAKCFSMLGERVQSLLAFQIVNGRVNSLLDEEYEHLSN